MTKEFFFLICEFLAIQAFTNVKVKSYLNIQFTIPFIQRVVNSMRERPLGYSAT